MKTVLNDSARLGVVVIGAGVDRHGTVELLAQQHAGDLVRESEWRQGKQYVRPRFDCRAQAISATDDKNGWLPLQIEQLFGEACGSARLTLFGHRVDAGVFSFGQRFEDPLALAFDIAVLKFEQFEVAGTFKALREIVAERSQRLILHTAYGNDGVAIHVNRSGGEGEKN